MGGRQDKGWGWEMRTKGTQSCFGAHPPRAQMHQLQNVVFFFLPKFIRSHLHPSQAATRWQAGDCSTERTPTLQAREKGRTPAQVKPREGPT